MFEKTIDYARESLIAASEAAVDRAGDRLGQVVDNASQAIDEKLDKISQELHNQRSLTKDDMRELVDYAADKLSVVLDERIAVMRQEITELVQEKTEYFKAEIDAFFIQRQRDLARERRRLIINIVLAAGAALGVGAVSLLYKGIPQWDLLTVFRVVLAALGRLRRLVGGKHPAPLDAHVRTSQGHGLPGRPLLGLAATHQRLFRPAGAGPAGGAEPGPGLPQ